MQPTPQPEEVEEVKKKDSEGSVEETTDPIVKPKTDSVMAEKYVPAANERHLIHAKMEVENFHPKTGERLSVPIIQKFHLKEWPQIEKMAPSQGYAITILFDPRKK